MLDNFSFVIPKQLAGMARPGGFSPLEEDLHLLKRKEIGAIVSLTERAPSPEAILEAGFDFKHIPLRDFSPPTEEQIDQFVAFAREMIQEQKRAVVVHCTAGQGRTGTMLACYLVALGESGVEAVESVRRIRPGSIETREQEAAVYRYEERLKEGVCEE